MKIRISLPMILSLFILFPKFGISQWNKMPFPSSEELHMVRFASENIGWVIGANYIYKTIDGGNSWVAQDTIFGDFGSEALYAIDTTTVIYSDFGNRGIRRTTNGGNTWYTADSSKYYYWDFKFVNDKLGFAAAGLIDNMDSAIVRKTTDGGETWTTTASIYVDPPADDFDGISFIDSLNGWAVTYNGIVYHSTDGGYNWVLQDSIGYKDTWQTYTPARDIQFITKDIGWVVGGLRGDLLLAKTTNGGKEWNRIILDMNLSSTSAREIKMLNEKVGWYVGSRYIGQLMKTEDGGKTWVDQTPSGIYDFKSISVVNDSIAWVVGGRGIIKATIGDITSVPDQDIDINQYWLAQNYPNPFNPTTTVKYNLIKSEFVMIRIINLIGEEVKTIENGFQSSGEHTLMFDAKDLPSGIYFYQLISENYTETKKLLLVK